MAHAAPSACSRGTRRTATLDVEDLHQLEREILQVGEMIQDMEMKVNVPRWTVQAWQAAGAELPSSASAGVSSVGGVSVEQRTGPCDLSKAKAATIFSAVLLAAVALAVCVAKLS